MQEDFHYYAAYCAAYIAGYSHEESLQIAWSDQFTDCCSRTFLQKVKGPEQAATTQLQLELMDARTDTIGLQDITRIWSAFHFLPKDLSARVKAGREYRWKYRLICGPNGDLVVDTVKLAKEKGLPAIGLAMHILCDTWAHANFAGTPSLVINNNSRYFYEILESGERQIVFSHNPTSPDDLEKGNYTSSLYSANEQSIMNLGHGRVGHFPDYSFAKYRYLPAWGDYEEIVKDNPSDYYHAFAQMVYALKYLRGDQADFCKDTYDLDALTPYKDRIEAILNKRQLIANADWKAFGEELSGQVIEDFDTNKYLEEYVTASKTEKDQTFLGLFFLAALRQKSMVTGKIFQTGNLLTGFAVNYAKKGFKGLKDFKKLLIDMNQ